MVPVLQLLLSAYYHCGKKCIHKSTRPISMADLTPSDQFYQYHLIYLAEITNSKLIVQASITSSDFLELVTDEKGNIGKQTEHSKHI